MLLGFRGSIWRICGLLGLSVIHFVSAAPVAGQPVDFVTFYALPAGDSNWRTILGVNQLKVTCMGDFGNPAPISIHRFGNNRTIEVKKGDDPHATLSAWTNGPRNPFGSGTPLDPFVWRLGEADSAVGCRGDVTGAANAVARNLFQGAFEFENAQTGILSAGGRVLTVTGRVEGRLDRTVMEALGFGEGWSRSVVGNLSLTVTSPDPIAVRSEYNHEGRVSNFSMTVEVVPEPATLLAVGIGFASCIFRFRRRAS